MVENSIENGLAYEATPFQNGDEFDLHKGTNMRLPLEDARKLAATANVEMQIRRENLEQKQANSIESYMLRVGDNLAQMRRGKLAEEAPARWADAA